MWSRVARDSSRAQGVGFRTWTRGCCATWRAAPGTSSSGLPGHTGSGSASETSRTFLLCARGGPEFSPPEKEPPRNSRRSRAWWGCRAFALLQAYTGGAGVRLGPRIPPAHPRPPPTVRRPPSTAHRPAFRAPCPQQWPLRPAWSPTAWGKECSLGWSGWPGGMLRGR